MNALSATWTPMASALGNHLWQSTLFAAIAALLALTLRNYQARTRYWIWLAASAKFLIPFSLLLSIGSHLAWHVHPTASQPVIYAAIDQVSQPFTGMTLRNIPITPASAHPSPMIPIALATAWLCGFLAVVAFWCIQLRRVSRVVHEAKPLLEGREIEILRRLEQIAKLPKPMRLLSSRDSMEPGVVGIVQPVLLWPEGISQHLDDAHLEAILAHEICHVQRRDNLTSSFHMLVEALFWFHPLVWWLEKKLVNERERACDEQVLQLGKQPQIYAESILKVCKFCIESPLTCVSGITGADLKKRIVQIMTEPIVRKLDLGKKLLLAAVGLMAVCVPIVFGQIIAAQSTPEPDWQKAADSKMVFAVASIRPNNSDQHARSHIVSSSHDGRLTVINVPLKMLFQFAFGTPESQISGIPAPLSSQKFDIEARSDPSIDAQLSKLDSHQGKLQKQLMLQALLADRFKLTWHKEVRQLPVFDLVIAKGGSKLQESKADGRTYNTGSNHIDDHGVTTPVLADQLAGRLDRPVLDKTGLTGRYDLTLNWTPDDAPQSASDSAPSIFTAVQEQLGLKLESTKGPVDTLVIDHIEEPSPN